MIGASLLVISVVIGLVVQHEVGIRREQIRAQGIGLANSLARIPLDRLVPDNGQLGPLPLLRATQTQSLLAYATVVDRNGMTLGTVSVADVGPPDLPVVANPSDWMSEDLIELDQPAVRIREFGAPVLRDGVLVGRVRIGYFEPGYGLVLRAASFHAQIALVVFLLIPLAALWLRREIRPLAEAASALSWGDEDGSVPISSAGAPSEAIDSIVERFRLLGEQMESRAESMQRERLSLLASSKVVAHQKNRVETLFEAFPNAIVAFDESGRLTLVNQRAEAQLRKSRDELIGKAPAEWSPAPEVSRLVARYAGAKGRLMRSESVEFAGDEAGPRRFEASVYPLPGSETFALVLRDVSQEYAARKTQAEFLAHMAHELKAPLNVMSLYSEDLLGPEGQDESSRITSLNIIRDEIDRLNGLINNIFSIGRIESGVVSLDRHRVRPKELFEDVFEAASRDGESLSLEFEIDVPDSMSPIFVDKQLFSVAIKNLLTNAIKYNHEGGKVSLLAEDREEGLSIRVLDTGCGISEEEIDRVFEKFYRSEDDATQKVAGHGLGLALVKEIVALHGGEIQVSSEIGVGSEFALLFNRNSAIFREES